MTAHDPAVPARRPPGRGGAKARFTQTDVKRAVAGVQAAGLAVGRVEIAPDGKIVILTAKAAAPLAEPNPWDALLKQK